MLLKSGDSFTTDGQSGLTLVELLIALVVISLSVMAVYQMFITGTELISEQYYRQYALEKAQSWMERMQYYETELDTVPMDFNRSFIDTLIPESDEHVGILANCRIKVEHSDEVDPIYGIPYYSLVEVVYNWQAPSGREYNVELRSKF